jgi:hypothetical protein
VDAATLPDLSSPPSRALVHIKVIKRSVKSNRLSRARIPFASPEASLPQAIVGGHRAPIAQLKELPRWGE